MISETKALWNNTPELRTAFANFGSFSVWLGKNIWKLPSDYSVTDMLHLRKKQRGAPNGV